MDVHAIMNWVRSRPHCSKCWKPNLPSGEVELSIVLYGIALCEECTRAYATASHENMRLWMK